MLVTTIIMATVVPVLAAPADDAEWTRLETAIARVAPNSGFVAAEIVDGDCQVLHEAGADRRLAIGSAFKLYVLAELARQVASGEASWNERMAVRADLRSMPSGAMLHEAAGTRHTLRYFAERMIAESDNTATDHLIERLGRKRIEAALPALGHEAPELNTPFLLTREFFAFKIAVPPTRIDAYLAATLAEQRDILATQIDPIALDERYWGDWTGPRRIESVEWFASPRELCRVLAALDTMADRPALAPIRDILAINRGGLPNPALWPYAGFKGGYEAGVSNLTWLLARQDGRRFVLTATFNDPVRYVDQGTAWNLVLNAADRLSRAP